MKQILNLIVLCLFMYQLDAQDGKFDCNGDLIITLYNSSSGFGNTNAYNISVTDDLATFNDLTTFIQLGVNSTAFNSVDRYIYGMSGSEIMRLKSDGTYDNLGKPSYFPNFVSSAAGDFDSEGIYWIHERNNDLFIGIDVNNGLAEHATIQLQWHPSSGNTGPFRNTIDDIVFDPLQPYTMYTYQRYGDTSNFGTRGHLLRADMDPSSPTYGFVYSEGALSSQTIIHLGAMFFDSKGVLFGYGAVTSSNNQNQLIKIDRNPAVAVTIATGPAASSNDGCSCPFSMYLTKATEDAYNVCLSELMKFDYVIGNSSNIVPSGVIFNDSFPPDFEIVDIDFSEPFGSITTGTGVGTNKIEITDITFSNKEVTFSIYVRPSPVSGFYSIQADLTNLPARFGTRLVSDDPETFFNDDATKFIVDYEYFPDNFSIGDDILMCEGETANFIASLPLPGTEVTWNSLGSGPSFSTELPGMIVAEAILGGCNAYDTVMVEVVPYPEPAIGDDLIFCEGEIGELGVPENSDHTYMWNTTTANINSTIEVTETGTYILEVNNQGCIAYDTAVVEAIPYPELAIGEDLLFCQGEVGQLGVSQNPDYIYSWNIGNNNSTIDVSETGTYILEVDNRGCISYDTALVEIVPYPELDIAGDTLLCLDQTTTLSVPSNPDYFYTWSTGDFSNFIEVDESGTYMIEANDRGCKTVKSAQVVYVFEEYELGFEDVEICEGTPISIYVNNSFDAKYNWTWSNGSTINDSFLIIDNTKPDMSGIYKIQMKYLECEYNSSFDIQINPLPELDVEQEVTYDICDSIHLSVVADPLANISWSPADVVNCVDCSDINAMITEDTYFEVTATDSIGCATTDSIFVNIEDTGLGAPVHIPNIFSPNADNQNDAFIVRPLCYEIKEFKIYDRWGNMVYTKDMQPNSDTVEWDGYNQIGLCMNGVYAWYGLFKFINSGEEVILSGDVTLIR